MNERLLKVGASISYLIYILTIKNKVYYSIFSQMLPHTQVAASKLALGVADARSGKFEIELFY